MEKCDKDIIPIVPTVQNYDWGMGKEGIVAKLASTWYPLEDDTRYAELWLGTHQKSPSLAILESQESSNDNNNTLEKDTDTDTDKDTKQQTLGQAIQHDLPFLLKVLSIEKALSIQAHPDQTTAKLLNKLHPDIYTDSNHKPEMIIALTPFYAMCGFARAQTIAGHMKRNLLFRSLFSDETFHTLMQCTSPIADHFEEEAIKSAFQEYILKQHIYKTPGNVFDHIMIGLSNLSQSQKGDAVYMDKENTTQEDVWFKILCTQFPLDWGVFCIYFLNLVHLNPGEAIFIEANTAHAYLRGQGIECMACSDNVIRGGLTSKFKDEDTLCKILRYMPKVPRIIEGKVIDKCTTLYAVDTCREFAIETIQLLGNTPYPTTCQPGDSLFLHIDGNHFSVQNDKKKWNLNGGSAFYLPKDEAVWLSSRGTEGSKDLPKRELPQREATKKYRTKRTGDRNQNTVNQNIDKQNIDNNQNSNENISSPLFVRCFSR